MLKCQLWPNSTSVIFDSLVVFWVPIFFPHLPGEGLWPLWERSRDLWQAPKTRTHPKKNVRQEVKTNCQITCQMQRKYQIECQNICERKCQVEWQMECQKICKRKCQVECQKICERTCQIECQKICEKMPDRMSENM